MRFYEVEGGVLTEQVSLVTYNLWLPRELAEEEQVKIVKLIHELVGGEGVGMAIWGGGKR